MTRCFCWSTTYNFCDDIVHWQAFLPKPTENEVACHLLESMCSRLTHSEIWESMELLLNPHNSGDVWQIHLQSLCLGFCLRLTARLQTCPRSVGFVGDVRAQLISQSILAVDWSGQDSLEEESGHLNQTNQNSKPGEMGRGASGVGNCYVGG